MKKLVALLCSMSNTWGESRPKGGQEYVYAAGTSSLGRVVIFYQLEFPQPDGTSISYYDKQRYRNIYIDGCSHFYKASIVDYRFMRLLRQSTMATIPMVVS